MKGSKQKRSAFLKRSYIRQCLIVVLAFLMVLQFSAPTVRSSVFADNEDAALEQLQNEALNADLDKTVEDGETDQVDPPKTSDEAQETGDENNVTLDTADTPDNDGNTTDQVVIGESSDEQGDVEAPKKASEEQKEDNMEDSEEPEIVFGDDSEGSDTDKANVSKSNASKADEETEEPNESKEDLEEESADGEEASSADVNSDGDLKAVVLQGEAAQNEEQAAMALMAEGLSAKKAYKLAKEFFHPLKDGYSTEIGIIEEGDVIAGDGSFIEYMHAKWITEDTDHEHGDTNDLLYVRPPGDNVQTIRLQLDYGLSGEWGYNPGDVRITIPASMFRDRFGNDYGELIFRYPEEPATNAVFSWKKVGDNYVFTNNEPLLPATKGFIQVDITGLVPHNLVDMDLSEEFQGQIEVTTHAGNTLSLHSEKLQAEFDTEAIIKKVTKRAKDVNVVTLDDSQVPEGSISESGKYVKVKWTMTVTAQGNTYYTLDYNDWIPQEYRGFILGVTEDDVLEVEHENIYTGYQTGGVRTFTIETAYPYEEVCEPGEEYVFHNNVKYTLTEVDEEVEYLPGMIDPQLQTEAEDDAQVVWSVPEPEPPLPIGHFMIYKNGNDDKPTNTTHMNSSSSSDIHMWEQKKDHWYGIYPTALNQMRDIYQTEGENGYYNISYTIDSVGYTMPWMFDEASYATDGAAAPKLAKNYTVPVTMITKDWGLSLSRSTRNLTVLDDYKYVSVEFPADPYIYSGVPNKINEDGSFSAQTPKDGTFKYTKDNNKANWPDMTLQILRNGNWEDWAVASWKSGNFKATLADGTEQTSRVIDVPEDTESIRTIVVNQNTATEGSVITNAAIDYDIRVVFGLRTTESIMQQIENLYANSRRPRLTVYNRANLTAKVGNSEIVNIGTERQTSTGLDNRDAYDILAGYEDDVMVIPSKTAKFNPSTDYDAATNTMTIHYSAKVEKRTSIDSLDTYEQAVAEGRIEEETHAVWRDLLPEGVVPKYDTIQPMREGDSIKDIDLIYNYKGSGRTLLVVEMDLTPAPKKYTENGMTYYMDVPGITFDGVIDLSSQRPGYLDNPIHNVISYQSNNSQLGTVDGYMGETDNPISDNNIITSGAMTDAEREIMTDLDENCDTASFVFAGAVTQFDIPAAGVTGLDKRVMVNNDGWWSKGLYYDDPEGNRRDVYVGGVYAYRIVYMPQEDTSLGRDIVLFDSLENYYATMDNDWQYDLGAPRWKGTLRGINTTYLEEMGCDPVIYYRTEPEELDLSEGFDGETGRLGNMDLNDPKWIKASDYTGDIKNVRAFAIDCSMAKDGGKFVLNPGEAITVIVDMDAPTVDENGILSDYFGENIDSDPHAYNNIYAIAKTIDIPTGENDYYHSIHTEYTKVGLKNRSITVTKEWEDEDDRDGLRPETIKIELLQDGKPMNPRRTVTLPIIGEDGEEIWTYEFENINTTDPEGNVYNYSFAEIIENENGEEEYGAPEGYTYSLKPIDGDHFRLVNKHIPEKTFIDGEKTWEGDENLNIRPEYIKVTLWEVLADGTEVYTGKYQKVYPTLGPDNEYYWTYSFTDLDKYRNNNGVVEEIRYVVHEERVGNVNLYEEIPDGYDLHNKYHPYGDLNVKKELTNATDLSKDETFTFGFEFYETKTDKGELDGLVVKDYVYEIVDEDGNVIEDLGGTVSSGQTITIHGGQTIHVKDIEDGYWYKVYEIDDDYDGYDPITPAPDENGVIGYIGKISANIVLEKTFVNNYDAHGNVEMDGFKTLYGRELLRNKFHYYVYLVNEDGTETLVSRNGANAAPDTTTEENGQIVSTGPIEIASFEYNLADDGKTYTYRIEEVVGRGTEEDLQNAVNEDGITYAEATPEQRAAGGFKLDGYIYDSRSYFATVEVSDNGDGTMDCDLKYFDKDGNPLPEGGKPQFENYYEAEGDYQFKARKVLKGREPEPEEFEFELSGPYVVNENGEVELLDSDVLPMRAKNNARNIATFDTLHFDQSDIGKTYYYAIKEVIPSDEDKDPTVHYTDKVYGYKLTITDGANNDGSLAVNEIPVTPVDADGNQVVQDENGDFTIVGWVEENAEDAVFENSLEPGELTVSKHIVRPINDAADPDQLFHFKVVLTGPDLDEGPYPCDITEIEYEDLPESAGGNGSVLPDPEQVTGEETAESEEVAAEAESKDEVDNAADEEAVTEKTADHEQNEEMAGEPGVASNARKGGNIITKLLDVLASLFADKAYAAEGDVFLSDTYRNIPYKLIETDRSGIYELVIGTAGETLEMSYRVDGINANSWPWHEYAGSISKISFEGTVKATGSIGHMFSGQSIATEIDLKGLDTSEVLYTYSMFYNCQNARELDCSTMDTRKVESMYGMFYGCYHTRSIKLGGLFDTSKVDRMDHMFHSCWYLTELNLSNFDTSKVELMDYMFMDCRNLKSITFDKNKFNTSLVEDMQSMFEGCKNLTELDLSHFETSKVRSMKNMLKNCEKLETLDISNFSTAGLSQYLNRAYWDLVDMFRGTKKLSKVKLGPNFAIHWAPETGQYYSHDDDASKVALENPPTSAPYTGFWIREDGLAGPYTAEELVQNYTADMTGTWVWQKGPAYKITFVPESEEAVGSMPDGYSWPDQDYTLPANKFRWYAHEFTHWTDNYGNRYENLETIPGGTFDPGEEITLTAHFKEVEYDPSEGIEIDLWLHDNEMATIHNIPAGTTYQVWEEDLEEGWICVAYVDDTGEIHPLETANAKFWNQYYPGFAFVQFNGRKLLDEVAAEADSFNFELNEEGNTTNSIYVLVNGSFQPIRLPYVVTTGAGGKVQFPTILYTESDIGTHTYTITESVPDPQDPTIDYDSHTETVTVVVSKDEDGNLKAVKTEDEDGIVFKNKTKPGSLTLTKHGVNVTNANKDDVFTFEVKLYDKNSRPLTTNENIIWYLTGSYEHNTLTLSSGTATLTLKAGETINIEGLPAGTTYSIRETGIPKGWSQMGYVGEEGTIVTSQTAAAEFTNEYNAKGHGQIEAKKMLENANLEQGQFGFYLYDENHNLIEGPVYNNAPLGDGHTAPILFSVIEYTFDDIGEHIYYVKEMIPEESDDTDDHIKYDSHEERVTVTVSDSGKGKLDVVVSYDDDGAVFVNEEEPGSLRINKVVAEGSPEGKEFSFKVTFFDADGIDTGDKEFAWMAFDSDDATDPSTQRTVKSGGTLKVVGGGHIIISDIPAGYTYKVEELETKGWIETHEGNEGTIVTDETAVATFSNEYKATGNVTFDAVKYLEGKPLRDKMFEFGVYDEDNNLVAKGRNDANGNVTFDDIEYEYSDAGKTYNYTIREIVGNLPGISYDNTIYNATVTITDNGDGTLNVVKDDDFEQKTFRNTYEAIGSITFKGTKTLNGREIKDDDVFTFEVKEGDKVVAAATGAKTGEHTAKIEYPTITYTLDDVGEHTYTVKETTEDGNGITVDTITYTVIVNITDNEDGTLNVEKVDGSDDFNALNFVNNYAANGDITFNGTKQLNGRPLEEGEKFEFTLYDEDKNVIGEPVMSGENGAISFPTLHYTHKDDGKEFIYYAKETSKDGKGITVDTREYKITVTVTDLGNGKLDIEAVTDKEGIDVHHLIFVNKYEATGTLPFEGTKTLEGREMTEDDVFTFQVVDEKGNTWEVQNDADGNINYPEIEYVLNGEQDDTGTHTYTVTETTEDGNGIVVDTNEYVVVAEVKDNKDGTLNVDTKDGDDPMSLDFTNEYSAEGEIDFEATKELLGRDLKEEEFRFGLYEDDKLISIAKNDEDGNIYFSKIEYDLEDAGKTYEYVMKEIDDELGGVFYDDSEYKVTVKVTDNGDGTLDVEAKGGKNVVFVNVYDAVGTLELAGTKTLEGREMTKNDIFEFTVSEDGEVIQTVENDKDGTIEFEPIEYTLDDVGRHTYTVKETIGNVKGMVYDETEYTVKVEVSDNENGTLDVEILDRSDDPESLDFVNSDKPEEPPGPRTGDTTEFIPYIMAMAVSGLALLVLLLKRRKKEQA